MLVSAVLLFSVYEFVGFYCVNKMTHKWSITKTCALSCVPVILLWAIKVEKIDLSFPETLETNNKEMWAFLAQNGNLVSSSSWFIRKSKIVLFI